MARILYAGTVNWIDINFTHRRNFNFEWQSALDMEKARSKIFVHRSNHRILKLPVNAYRFNLLSLFSFSTRREYISNRRSDVYTRKFFIITNINYWSIKSIKRSKLSKKRENIFNLLQIREISFEAASRATIMREWKKAREVSVNPTGSALITVEHEDELWRVELRGGRHGAVVPLSLPPSISASCHRRQHRIDENGTVRRKQRDE